MRPLLVVLAALFLSAFSHAENLYSGNANTLTGGARKTDPFAFKVEGGKLAGTIYSNTFSRRIPVRGEVNPAGRFRIRVKNAGVSGFVTGKVSASRLKGSGKLHSKHVGGARLRLDATVAPRRSNGVPDITGECEFPGENQYGNPEFKSFYLKFTRSEDGTRYNYTAILKHYWYHDQTWTRPGDFPAPSSMNFSFSQNFGPQQHSFTVTFSPVSDTQVHITIDTVGPSQTGVWRTQYQGFYTVRP